MKFVSVKHNAIRYSAAKTIQLNGGLNTRMSSLIVSASENKRMQSPEMKNCELFASGAVAKRKGIEKQGGLVGGGGVLTDQNDHTTEASQYTYGADDPVYGDDYAQVWWEIPFSVTGVGSATITEIALWMAGIPDAGSDGPQVSIEIYSGSTYLCASGLATISGVSAQQTIFSAFTGQTNLPIGSYTMRVKINNVENYTQKMGYKSGSGSFTIKRMDISNVTHTIATFTGQPYILWTYTALGSYIQGLYDYRYTDSTGGYNQAIIAASNAGLFLYDGSTNWNIIKTIGSSASTYYFDFCTIKNLMVVAEFAKDNPKIWDGSTSGGNYPVMKLGYRASWATNQSASAGTVPAGTYTIMPVTTLKSGGYRAGEPKSVTLSDSLHYIEVQCLINSSTDGSQFGFDIDTTATTWFMTASGGSTYYKIPSANMSVTNPCANSTTAFNITAITGLTSANTLLQEYGLDQSYFTNQVDTPYGKYVRSWNGFLVMTGDKDHQSRLWVSELGAPQIWAEGEGTLGYYVDIGTDDGQIITGMEIYNTFLYIFKNQSIYRVEYTGNASLPFLITKMTGNIGCLSHWTIKEIPTGLFFLSEGGPAICYGSSSQIIGEQILDYFDENNQNSFNIANMVYSSAGVNVLKKQVWVGVSSKNSSTRDLILVYDWENNAWWFNDGIDQNYFATICNASGFQQVWSGDYTGNVYRHDTGDYDDTANIEWVWSTPDLLIGGMGEWKTLDNIFVFGKSTGATLTCDVYLDKASTKNYSVSIDCSTDAYKVGVPIPIRGRCKTVKFRFSYTGANPVQVEGLRIEAANIGSQT